MIEKSRIIRKETRFTKNNRKYGVNIILCPSCNEEICINNHHLKTSSGFCKTCERKQSRVVPNLQTRVCKTCGIEQDISQFLSKNAIYSKLRCNRCQNLAKYSINYKEYLDLLEKQNGTCAICHQPETCSNRHSTNTLLSVDHSHETNEIRGLLCGRCNRAIGLLKDNKEFLQNAINYLT